MLGYVIRHLWAVFGPVSEEEEGQALTEYGLILALIAIAAIGALVIVGGLLTDVFEEIQQRLADALPGS
jgi:pilus assembly protein Flp/PilA